MVDLVDLLIILGQIVFNCYSTLGELLHLRGLVNHDRLMVISGFKFYNFNNFLVFFH